MRGDFCGMNFKIVSLNTGFVISNLVSKLFNLHFAKLSNPTPPSKIMQHFFQDFI